MPVSCNDIDTIKARFSYEAAMMYFNHINRSLVVSCLDDLMQQGVWADSFNELLFPETDHFHEFKDAVTSALKDIGVSFPQDKESALWFILKLRLTDIATEEIVPLDGLVDLFDRIYFEYDFHAKSEHCLGDSHGIEHLIGIYLSYDDFMEGPIELVRKRTGFDQTIIDLNAEILQHARDWVTKQSG